MDYNIIKFSADWCGQCQVMDMNLRKAGIPYRTIDVDKDHMIAEEYNVRNLPVVLVTDGHGNEVDRFAGILTVQQIKDKIGKYVHV